MTRPCPGPLAPTPPRTAPPPGACDTHIHVIGPYDAYPLNPKCSYTAPEASIEKIVTFLDVMKIDRAVIAHVTAHGMDMTVTLDALKVLGDRGRGVAMLATDIDDSELDRLHDGGIRAIRLTPLFGDEVTLDVLKQMCGRIARLGWHMVYAPPTTEAWLEAAPLLTDMPTPVVVDHMAWRGWDVARGLDQPGLILGKSFFQFLQKSQVISTYLGGELFHPHCPFYVVFNFCQKRKNFICQFNPVCR